MIDYELKRKLYGEYIKGVAREGKKGAVGEPLSFQEWQADFDMLTEVIPKSGINYTMTELRKINKQVITSSKRTLTRKQNRALEENLGSGDWADELSSEQAVEVEMFLRERGYYAAADRGEARQWFAFNGMDLRDFLETMGLASWHMFFNS